MSLSSEITSLTSYTSSVERDLTNIKTALNNKGVSTSSSTKLGDVPGLIKQVKTTQEFETTIYATNNSPYFTDWTVYDNKTGEQLGEKVTINGYSSGQVKFRAPRESYRVDVFPYGGPSSMFTSKYYINHGQVIGTVEASA